MLSAKAKGYARFAYHFPNVNCIYAGMYGDCSAPNGGCRTEEGVCIYAENPAANYCAEQKESRMCDKELTPVGSTEKVWKYAHPHDVGIFLDGTYGWFLRQESFLKKSPEFLKDWLKNKPANIYLPSKKMRVVKRPGYELKEG